MTGIGKIPEPPPGFGGEPCDRIALARPCRCARGRFAHPTASGSGAGLLDARDGGPRPRVRGLWRVGVVFALIGVLIAYLIVSAQRQPSRLLLMFIVLMCFEVFFLAVVTWLAHPVLNELTWWAILLANALAAIGMLVYFFVGHRALGRVLLGPWTRVAREGLIAGLLGAVAVAVWFLLYDLAAGVPLRTPALLGGTLFHGLRDPSALVITMPLVLQYTVVHGLAFVLFGWAAAGLLALADREPLLLFGLFMLFCCFEVFFIAAIAILAERLFETIAWWTILAANLLASLVMLGYFFREHRVTWREFLAARR